MTEKVLVQKAERDAAEQRAAELAEALETIKANSDLAGTAWTVAAEALARYNESRGDG